MKGLGIVARWLFIQSFAVPLLSASITLASNSLRLYKYGLAKHPVGETTGLAEAELDKIAKGLITYFHFNKAFIALIAANDGEPFELFTEREVIHPWDIRTLFRLVYYLLGSTAAFVIVYGAAILLQQRGRAWQVFFSFEGEYWILEPRHYLPKLFPQGF